MDGERLKVLRSAAAGVAAHPLVPAELRRACCELVELVADVSARLQSVEGRLRELELREGRP